MIKRNIVIIGAGGFAREVMWLIQNINEGGKLWEIMGFIDEDKSKQGSIVNGLTVLGDFTWLQQNNTGICAVIATGNPVLRKRFAEKCKSIADIEFPNLVHPSVKLSEFVNMGKGNIICASSILTVNISLGNFNIVNLNCTIGHDVEVQNYCTLSPGVNISGNVTLNDGCELGTNSCVIPCKTVGAWSIIGAGSVVTKDIGPACTAVGIPARVIKYHTEECI